MEVKKLIKILKKMPQDAQVFLYQDTEWSYDGLEIKGANLEPICVGHTLDCGETYETCGACQRSDGYCVFNDDGVYDVVEEHVVLDIEFEKYKITKQ